MRGSSSARRRWSDESLGGALLKGAAQGQVLLLAGGGVVVAGCQVTHRSQLIEHGWGWGELAQTPAGTGLRLQLVNEDFELTETELNSQFTWTTFYYLYVSCQF